MPRPFPKKRFVFLACLVFLIISAGAAWRFASADKTTVRTPSPPQPQPLQKPPVVQVIDVYLGFGGFEPDDIPDARPGPALVTVHDLRGDRKPTTYRLTAPDGKQTALNTAPGIATDAEVELSPGVFLLAEESGGKSGVCKITVVKE